MQTLQKNNPASLHTHLPSLFVLPSSMPLSPFREMSGSAGGWDQCMVASPSAVFLVMSLMSWSSFSCSSLFCFLLLSLHFPPFLKYVFHRDTSGLRAATSLADGLTCVWQSLQPAGTSCVLHRVPLTSFHRGLTSAPPKKCIYIYILANYVQYTYIYNFISYMTSLCYSAARDRSCMGWICGFFHKLLILWKWWCNPGEIVRVSVVLPAVLYIALTRGHEIELASVLLLGFPRSCADNPGSWSWVFPPYSVFSETSSYSGTLQCS